MEEKKKKTTRYFLGSILAIVILSVIFYISIPRLSCGPIPVRLVICKSNLRYLDIGLLSYHEENEAWPANENWCTLLNQEWVEDIELFRCPFDKIGPCSYAMNENIPADANELPPDLVLLFESDPGWNQTGGSDDVVTNRHGENNPGANIAFADGHVEFIPAEDIPTLRWTVDE